MPNKDNQKLEYNQEKNSLKFPFMIYADLEVLLEKYILAKLTRKSLTQRKKLCIYLPVTHCLQIVPLMKQKTNVIVTEGKTV